MNRKLLTLIAAACACSAGVAMASPSWCGYTDSFHTNMNNKIHPVVTNASSDQNIQVQWSKGSSDFALHDAASCPQGGGHATVTYQTSSGQTCTLNLHDGELMDDPTVSVVNCQGMQYMGMTYDGFMTYRYTLNFEPAA